MKVLYTAEALATGEGRNGHVRSTDGRVDLDVAVPKEMGGSGDGSNPEQLFAAGYSACFHSALLGVARQRKITVADSAIGASVSIGPLDAGGYTLAVHLEASLPGVERGVAQELVEQAHQVCPYSNATRGNIEVTVAVVEE
ncbi:organic hydroperoxide resistance protein [Oerskovia sp. NPDC056781]|uniref:organic hydroperoxide resistance protein n=1 Tax=Oerskovia sp. NPDC056781 TaxID=3345942 RepID=UPI00366EFBCD